MNYTITHAQIEDLADAICQIDGHTPRHEKHHISRAHQILIDILGPQAGQVYASEPESEETHG